MHALRELPAVHRLLDDPSIAPYEVLVGRDALRTAIAVELERARGGVVPPYDQIVAGVVSRLDVLAAESLVPVINGTGVILHTNLGRAPLAQDALEAACEIGSGYSNLEYDLLAGERGSRYARVTSLLREASGAGDALVVNNCAAAVLLILDTFAKSLEVVVSRNQLVEIGGGFRLPDVLERSGATLVEVGATNKVYLRDFERALSPRTALLMRSHPSNYSIEGFVQDVDAGELVALGRRAGVPVVEDLGSGGLVGLSEYGLPRERTVRDAVSDGIDLVAFSGDKLLGGPQAGIIVGSTPLVARLRSNPLLRALRVDKLTLAALAQTLRLHRSRESRERIPFYAMLGASPDTLRARAAAYAAALPSATVVESEAFVGGGALPTRGFPSIAVALNAPSPQRVAARLRSGRPALIARVDERGVIVDMRTIPPRDDAAAMAALERALRIERDL
ncbi:MAG: L-seryl-tRNA(Sec) selenium transferase [Vulcanimicrobiaceae bacterium]